MCWITPFWPLLTSLVLLAAFAFMNWGFRLLADLFGGNWDVRTVADPAGLPLLYALFVVFDLLTTPVSNTITRTFEIQAGMLQFSAARSRTHPPPSEPTPTKLDHVACQEAIHYNLRRHIGMSSTSPATKPSDIQWTDPAPAALHLQHCHHVGAQPPPPAQVGKKLTASLSAAGFVPQILEMPNGERHKKLATVERLSEQLSRRGADRNSVIVAFGGGVVGDVTGLLASLYMRGLELVQIPTTVLAQVDASIGGKTGVNLRAGKNLVGTFHHPRTVLIDPAVLSTLPDREFRAGLYEALKCGVIGKPELFAPWKVWMQRNYAATPSSWNGSSQSPSD